jgi:capsular polysaccharide transport system permease protein
MPEPAMQDGGSARQLALPGAREAIGPDDAAQVAKAISRALRRAANKSRAPSSIIAGGGGFAARRGDRAFQIGLLASFVAFVIAPLLFASIYWGLIASKQYVTETKFALRSSENGAFAALGVGGHDDKQIQDSEVIAKYILSRSMIEALNKKIDLKKIFSRPEADYFSRFDPDDPIELLEKYWKKRVDTSVDLMSGIISVHVRAFTPEDSLVIAQNVIDLSEKLVNELSTRSRRDALAQAQSELTRSQERLKAATTTMRDARNAEGVIDAPAAAEAINKIITQLKLDLAKTEESLALQSSASALQSPQVSLLNARAESLRKQIAEYSAQIAGSDNATSLAGHAGVLSERQIDLAIAQQQYALSAAAYESARIDFDRQRAYLVPFLRPTLAEKSIYPRRWIEWSIIVVPAILGWALLIGVAFLVRDHMAK